MNYIDTSVIVAYSLENHEKHEKAVKLLEKIEGEKIVSEITLLELLEVIREIMDSIKLDVEIEGGLKILFLLEYMIRICDVKVRSLKLKTKNFKLINETIQVSDIAVDIGKTIIEIGLDAVRAMHLVIAKKLGAKNFVTLDEEIIKNREKIERLYDLKIVF